MTHPVLGIWFHNPRDDYSSYQRLNVFFAAVFSILAVNAMFFGQDQQSIEQDLSISIYSALLTAPVGVLFPRLFARAAFKAEAQRSEPDLFAALNLRAAVDAAVAQDTHEGSVSGDHDAQAGEARAPRKRSGLCMRICAFAFLWLWCAGMIFLCLVRFCFELGFPCFLVLPCLPYIVVARLLFVCVDADLRHAV